MAVLKFWLDVFGETVGVEGVLAAFQSLLTIKKGTSYSNFQSNEPFSKFLRQLLRYELPWYGKKNNNNTLCQHCSLLRHLDCAAYDNILNCLMLFYLPLFIRKIRKKNEQNFKVEGRIFVSRKISSSPSYEPIYMASPRWQYLFLRNRLAGMTVEARRSISITKKEKKTAAY